VRAAQQVGCRRADGHGRGPGGRSCRPRRGHRPQWPRGAAGTAPVAAVPNRPRPSARREPSGAVGVATVARANGHLVRAHAPPVSLRPAGTAEREPDLTAEPSGRHRADRAPASTALLTPARGHARARLLTACCAGPPRACTRPPARALQRRSAGARA
jgi:hypothetical protein